MKRAAVAALLALVPSTAHAQTLKTVRLAGGEVRVGERVSPVTGGYVDPKTGRGRVEHRGGVLRLGRNVRAVRTSGLTTRVVARRGVRARLRLAQLLFAAGTTDVHVAESLGFGPVVGRFRITGGRLDARTLAGTVGHTGTLTLERGGRSITFFDLGLSAQAITAQMWDFRAPLATLADVRRRVIGLRVGMQARAALGDVAARELNEAFETAEFTAGMPLGTVMVEGRLRG